MIITSDEATKRLSSPLNLINKMREKTTISPGKSKAMNLFGIGRRKEDIEETKKENIYIFSSREKINKIEKINCSDQEITSNNSAAATPEVLPPETSNLDEVMDDANAKIKLSLAHDAALDTLVKAMQTLNGKLEELPAKQLASVATAASKVVNEIRTERNKTAGTKSVHLHFYSPEQKQITDYESMEV